MNSKTSVAMAHSLNGLPTPVVLDDKEERKLKEKLNSCLIDLSEEMTEPEPLLNIGEAPLFTSGNISVIGGAAKSRKTFLIAFLIFRYLDENKKGSVLLIDTEMAKFHTIKTAKRIHTLIGWDIKTNNKRLKVLSLREESPETRAEILKQSVCSWRPDLIFLDGVRDLVRDFNSPDESTNMVNLLMRLSSQNKCHICSVLHENKIGGQLRGHLGSELINKSETVIKVSRENNISTVKSEYSRNKAFEDFCFTINAEGLPELCQPEKVSQKANKLKDMLIEVFGDKKTMAYSELRSGISIDLNIKNRAAERKIKDALDLSVLIKNSVGDYYIKPDNINTDETELPF